MPRLHTHSLNCEIRLQKPVAHDGPGSPKRNLPTLRCKAMVFKQSTRSTVTREIAQTKLSARLWSTIQQSYDARRVLHDVSKAAVQTDFANPVGVGHLPDAPPSKIHETKHTVCCKQRAYEQAVSSLKGAAVDQLTQPLAAHSHRRGAASGWVRVLMCWARGPGDCPKLYPPTRPRLSPLRRGFHRAANSAAND